MDMNQRPFAGALPATLAAATLFGVYAGYTGLDADLGQSPSLLLATIAVFLLPACIAVAWRSASSALAQRRADEREAATVMTDVAPYEAETVPMAAVASIVGIDAAPDAARADLAIEKAPAAEVLSLTEVKVERRQQERRSAHRRARESQFAS